MINIQDKRDCCGCGACYSVCPQKAISLIEDREGFEYPTVNKDLCIDCSMCDKVCPIQVKVSDLQHNPKAYVVRSKFKKVLLDSTSGGAFTELAKTILNQKGVVFGSLYDDNFEIIHNFVTSEYELYKFRGSKYVQSKMGLVYVQIKNYLKMGTKVLFSGTPCQVVALKNFLQRDYENLVCIDVVCKGVGSPKVWRAYIDYINKKFDDVIEDIKFRNKTYGYQCSTMSIKFKSKKVYRGSGRVDLMLKSYFNELCSRPSCHDCKFKQVKRISDITIYDAWHIGSLVKKIKDDNLGYTSILIQSYKGAAIFDKSKENMDIYEVNLEKSILLDGKNATSSATMNTKRDQYFELLHNYSLLKAVQDTIPITPFDYIIENTKIVLYKLKVIKIIKSIKRKILK